MSSTVAHVSSTISHLVRGIERPVQSDETGTPNLLFVCMLLATEGWYDAALLLPSLVEDGKSGSVTWRENG